MQTIKELVKGFQGRHRGDLALEDFCVTSLGKMFYDNSSFESDMRALLRKSALIRKSLAEHKSLTRDKSSFQKAKSALIGELKLLSSFMEYVLEEMPLEAAVLGGCLSRNRSYIILNE